MALTVTFAGLENPYACEFPLSRGVTPSVCTLFCEPQELLNLPPGTITITSDDATIAFTNCAVQAANFRSRWDGTRKRWAVQIQDRRRLWSTRRISGEFNRRNPDGTLDSTTTLNAKGLASLCLTACGETNFVIQDVPRNIYPYVRWDNARADLALAQVCDLSACEVCPTMDDRFAVCALGTGGDLQELPTQKTPQWRYVPRSVPAEIRIVGGPSLWQSKLKLRAIAEETSGDQLALDGVSYKPTSDWENESPISFPNVTGDSQRAALESIYKRYRVLGQADSGLGVPNCPVQIASVAQYFPFQDYLLDAGRDYDGTLRGKKPYVDGSFWPYSHSSESASDIRYIGEFNLLKTRGEVHFPAPVFGLSSGTMLEPDIYLTVAYPVSYSGGGFERVEVSKSTGVSGGVEVVNRPELFATTIAVYSGYTLVSVVSTRSNVEAEAAAHLEVLARKYADTTAGEGTYCGFVFKDLDGKIAQITWRCGTKIRPTTQICLNEELHTYSPSRLEKKRREKLGGL